MQSLIFWILSHYMTRLAYIKKIKQKKNSWKATIFSIVVGIDFLCLHKMQAKEKPSFTAIRYHFENWRGYGYFETAPILTEKLTWF